MEYPERKTIRLPEFDYDAGAYFVTICTHQRRCVLSDIVVGAGVLCQAHIGNSLSNNMGYTFSSGIRRRFLDMISLCSVSICANSNVPYCKPTTCSEM